MEKRINWYLWKESQKQAVVYELLTFHKRFLFIKISHKLGYTQFGRNTNQHIDMIHSLDAPPVSLPLYKHKAVSIYPGCFLYIDYKLFFAYT